MSAEKRQSGFEEIEALIYRLFAEKQFALALLALVMVAQLLSAQFLLLRLSAPKSQTAAAPTAQQRVDVRCAAAGAQTMAGEAFDRAAARGKVVVVHLSEPMEACLADVTSAGASELVVGMSEAPHAAGR
jgi:hypothetical protein